MFANGKPRYWIGSYDPWHLLLPVAFFGVVAWMCTFPAVPMDLEPVRTVAPPPMSATSIESPASNSHFRASRIGDVEGRAQPGTLAVLYTRPRSCRCASWAGWKWAWTGGIASVWPGFLRDSTR